MAEDQKGKRLVDETAVYIQETLISVAARIGDSLKNAVEDAFDGADASVVKAVSNDLTRSFKSAAKFSNDIADNAFKIKQGLISSRDIEKQRLNLEMKRDALLRKMEMTKKVMKDLDEEAVKMHEQDFQNAMEALDVQEEQLQKDADAVANIEKNMGGLGEIFTRLSKNKFFGSIINADAGLREMRKTAKNTGNSFKILGKGIAGAFAGIEKASIILFAINAAVKVLKFIVSLFTAANAQTVAIAKNLGISKDQASVLRREIADTVKGTDRLYVTTDRLIEAQSQLVGLLERGGTFQQDNLIASTFLQHRLGLAADEASKLVGRAEAFGFNANEGVTSIIDLRNELTRSGENTATIGQLLKGVSQASGQIAASFGFSNQAIAKGVIAVRKFGLNLTQARSISESLLDFETSIGNELEAELLTGRQFNFERARALAATGDIAGATQEVMKQMKGLTAEQRKSPIIMQSLASAVGLSVDQLQDAYMLETDRARQGQQRIENEAKYAQYVKQVNRELGLQGEEREELLKKRRLELGIDDAQREALEKNVTIQEAFNESLNRARDAFNRMVDSNALDKLTDLIIDFANRASQVGFGRALLGGGVSAKQQQEAVTSAVGTYGEYQDKTAGIGKALYQMARDNAITQENIETFIKETGADREAVKKVIERRSQPGIVSANQRKMYESIQLDDFVIKTHPKDTLVMAGGTKLGQDSQKTNQLLERLISAVERGGDVYIDGNKAGRALVLASHKLS